MLIVPQFTAFPSAIAYTEHRAHSKSMTFDFESSKNIEAESN